MPDRTENPNTGYIAAFSSAVFLSLTSIFISYLNVNYQLPALVLAFWRELFVALILLTWFAFFKRDMLKGIKAHFGYLLAYGFVLALFNALWTISVVYNGAAVSTVMAYCSAAFTALLGWLILHESLSFPKIIAVALSLIGCALIVDALNLEVWRVNTIGIITGIFSGLFYAAYSLLGRIISQRGLNTWTTLAFSFWVAAGFMFLINLFFGSALPGGAAELSDLFWLGDSVPGWLILFTLALGPTLVGYGLYNISLKHLPSSVANLIVTIEPAFTAVVAYFTLGERYTLKQVMGSLLIMLGVIVIRVYKNKVKS